MPTNNDNNELRTVRIACFSLSQIPLCHFQMYEIFSIFKIGFKSLVVVRSCIPVAQIHTRKLLSFIVHDIRQKDYVPALEGNSNISKLLLLTLLLKSCSSYFIFF